VTFQNDPPKPSFTPPQHLTETSGYMEKYGDTAMGTPYPPAPQMAFTPPSGLTAGYPPPPSSMPGAPEPDYEAPGALGPVRLPFDLLFQSKAVGILLREPSVMADYVDIISPNHFDSEIHRGVVRVAFAYYRKYRQQPTADALKSEIRRESTQLKRAEQMTMLLCDLVDEAYAISLEESRYIADRMKDFCKRNAAKELALGLVAKIQAFEREGSGSFDELSPQIRRLASIGAPGGKGMPLHEAINDLPERLRNNSMFAKGAKVPTGLKKLDNVLDGGLAAGEIAFVAGGAGTGKSALLVQFAANAIKAGCNVMIYTMELKEEDYAIRLAQHMTGTGKGHVIENSMRYADRFQWMRQQLDKAKCYIKYYPPGVATVDMMRSHFSRIKAEVDSNKPWLIIVDYIEQLRMGDPEKVQTWELVGRIVDEMIAFGWEYSAPVWTASQVNRAGFAKVRNSGGRRHSGKEDIAASFKKVEKADLLVMFDQAELEKAAGTARLRVEKCRRGRDGFPINLIDQRPIMTFIELDDAQPVTAYSPRRMDREINPETGRPIDWLELRPEWNQGADGRYIDEGGSLLPPQMEIDEFLQEQVMGLSEEQIGLDLDDVRAKIEGRARASAPYTPPQEQQFFQPPVVDILPPKL
jgi:replicative DNA helicase